MGYYRCAVPGCPSRQGQGVKFKGFPRRNPNLAREWIKSLPAGVVIKGGTSICEVHFELSQFERVRCDGSKRLKDNAVPRLFHVFSKTPLGEVTNIPRHRLKESYPATSAKSLKLEPSNRLGDHTYCLTGKSVDDFGAPGNENDDPLVAATKDRRFIESCFAAFSEISPQHSPLNSNDQEAPISDQPPMLGTAAPQGPSASQDSLISGPEICVETTMEIVNEAPSDVESDVPINLSPSHGISDLCEDVTRNEDDNFPRIDRKDETAPDAPFVDLDIVTQKNATDLIRSQANQIALLTQQIQEEREKQVNILRAATNVQSLKRRNMSLKKTISRLQKKSHIGAIAPWLSKSQKQLLMRGGTRGFKWDPEMIREGLLLKMVCGTTGYASFVKRVPLLPSVRVLQRAIQFIKFDSGMLHEVFDLLKTFADWCKENYKDCQVVFDEMALDPGVRYDPSTKRTIGHCTFPTHTGLADKGLAIMLAGITKRWKVTVAIYFTKKKAEAFKKKKGQVDKNPTGEAFAAIIKEVISRAEAAGLRVCGITSDMGPDNLALWRALGVTGGRNETLVTSFPNPARPEAAVHVQPDQVHLFKNVKTALENNKVITLPDFIVKEENLPSPEVDYTHIQELYEYEENCEVKVAFRLKPDNIDCKKQFAKMNVGTHRAVLCHRTGVGLQFMAQKKRRDCYLTTAWFVLLLNTFFELVTCRGGLLALSKSNQVSYEKAIALLKRVGSVFQHMKIGKEWKPIQRGMKVLVQSLLNLQDYFLNERGYSFLLLGRFTQDCIENLFSLIRQRSPIPHCVAFLHCLKVISMAQYSLAIKGSAYDYDHSESIEGCDFLAEARKRAEERAKEQYFDSIEELMANSMEEMSPTGLIEWEECVLYDMSGSVVKSVSSNYNVCQDCTRTVKLNSDVSAKSSMTYHPRSTVTQLKEFTEVRADGRRVLQVYVTNEVFRAIVIAELSFRKYRHQTLQFKKVDVLQYFVENTMYVWKKTHIPDCHNITRKILEVFFKSRLKDFSRVEKERIDKAKAKSINRSSKSVAMRDSAKQITVTSPVVKLA